MNSTVQITFPDNKTKTFDKGTKAIDVAASISPQFAKKVLAVRINEQVVNIRTPIEVDSKVVFYTWLDEDGKYTFWHSSAHVLAEAVQSYFPSAKFAIGPPIENGFYYDIDFQGYKLTEEDINRIEKKMLQLASSNSQFEQQFISRKEAVKYYQKQDNPYKLELIQGLQDGDITFYTQNTFTDLCRGPHIPHTGYIKAVKILNIAGAYWRGDEANNMLTRIYAISFPNSKELDEYLKMYEEAKKRDHRKIGKALELFHFSENVGMGLPLWLPKGTIVREELQNFLHKAQKQAGYQSVMTPHIGHKNLYLTSGHYEKYGKDSFQPIQTPRKEEQFFLKPMNCPHHCEIYNARPRSYKELPLRLAEFGTVYRYEQHGELHGLTRVRGFTQDDAHIFCTPEQLKEEFIKVIDLVIHVFSTLRLTDFSAQISLRDLNEIEKYIGHQEQWQKAEQAIIEATKERDIPTYMEYGEAAFYGPKLDFMVKDALNRKWQLGTIQVDYNLPERFDLTYIDANNESKRPVMIHRAPFGSMERFLAILLENFGGNLPLWLAPIQVKILPISDNYVGYAEDLQAKLMALDIRVEIDKRVEKIGKKIRDAEIMKIPYMLIIGEKEMTNNQVSLRKHKHGDIGVLSIQETIERLQQEINSFVTT